MVILVFSYICLAFIFQWCSCTYISIFVSDPRCGVPTLVGVHLCDAAVKDDVCNCIYRISLMLFLLISVRKRRCESAAAHCACTRGIRARRPQLSVCECAHTAGWCDAASTRSHPRGCMWPYGADAVAGPACACDARGRAGGRPARRGAHRRLRAVCGGRCCACAACLSYSAGTRSLSFSISLYCLRVWCMVIVDTSAGCAFFSFFSIVFLFFSFMYVTLLRRLFAAIGPRRQLCAAHGSMHTHYHFGSERTAANAPVTTGRGRPRGTLRVKPP